MKCPAVRRNCIIAASLLLSALRLLAADAPPTFLLRETFSGPQLTPNLWDAQPFQPRLNYLGGGYLALSRPEHSLYSRQNFARRPGRCLAVVYCGNMHRGGADNRSNPAIQFSQTIRPANRLEAGPGFLIGQRQGFTARFINTAVPFGEGVVGPALDNDNVDTLFLTVLRERGAFYLLCGEPASTPPEARLCFVSHIGEDGPYHVALAGGRANSRIASADVVDLSGPWQEPFGLATVLDMFWDTALVKPDKGFGPWQKSGQWSAGSGLCHLDGTMLMDARSVDQYVEVRVTPTGKTKSVALLLRAINEQNCLRFELNPSGTRLAQRRDGKETEIPLASSRQVRLTVGEPHRLAARLEGDSVQLFVDDALAQSGRIPESAMAALAPDGTKVGIAVAGLTRLEEFVNWPCRVNIPQQLAARLPPIPLRADGEIILYDDFNGADGQSLDGRQPKIGKGTWRIGSGDWRIESGAARVREKDGGICKQGLGEVLIDCGASDIEISATIEFPPGRDKDFPHPFNNWFAGLTVRADSARPSGHINPRYLWQNGSPEIEVWDKPADTPENRARWRESETGPWAGHTASVLVGGSNITGFIRPGETHVLRLVVRGNWLAAFRDDVLVATAPTRVTQPAGTWVGLNLAHLGHTGCKWRDLRVRAFGSESQPAFRK